MADDIDGSTSFIFDANVADNLGAASHFDITPCRDAIKKLWERSENGPYILLDRTARHTDGCGMARAGLAGLLSPSRAYAILHRFFDSDLKAHLRAADGIKYNRLAGDILFVIVEEIFIIYYAGLGFERRHRLAG